MRVAQALALLPVVLLAACGTPARPPADGVQLVPQLLRVQPVDLVPKL